ncbi:MAG: DmsE family decaheme c-type cytochrome [Gammaproteobacteria bacterium]|nr:DmsE family decaheme c-type cytochrome [Gammaproteobacteria bacterium]NIT06814.1 DmsE family decaheme c-type cytochrome [Gammaproteobacteria bacterium]
MLGSTQVLAETDAEGNEFALKGAQTCLKCHDEYPTKFIFQTPHVQKADKRTPFATHECETCHGASQDHLIELAPPQIVFGMRSKNYRVSGVDEQNKVCLGCHESGLVMHWRGSQHQSADVPCASCHNVHAPKDPVLVKKEQAEVCFTCHTDNRAQLWRRSRHPIREGKVVCSDCHNSHGSPGQTLLAKNTVNETCFQCHAETRGPFLWEHQPVREDCTICHNPHGSVQPRMLVQRTPFLCNMCHAQTRHPSDFRDGSGLPANAGADNRLLGKGCLNCHSKIHGSNHPSGPGLTR